MRRAILMLTMALLTAAPGLANTFTVVATVPAHGATSVALNAEVSFTFDRPVDLAEIEESIMAEPSEAIEIGNVSVSDDGRHVSFLVSHTASTDYVWVVSGSYLFGGGTGEIADTEPFVLRYTTAASAGTSVVAGTIDVREGLTRYRVGGRDLDEGIRLPIAAPMFRAIQSSQKERIKDGSASGGAGVPTSQIRNQDPDGALVILSTVDPLSGDDRGLAAAAVVMGIDGEYQIPMVRPGQYYPYAIKAGVVADDSPIGDVLNSVYFGFYDPNADGTPDVITVSESGVVPNVDFSITALGNYAGTAADMEVIAREEADGYAADQILIGVATSMISTNGKSAAWMYTYISPWTGMLTEVVVSPFEAEVSLSEFEGTELPAELPVPFQDSDSMYLTALANGGEEFLAEYPYSFTNVLAGFRLDSESGPETDRPFWAVTFAAITGGHFEYLNVFVDFESGEFLGSERSDPLVGRYSDRFREAVAELEPFEGSFDLVGLRGENVSDNGVAEEWRFEFYAEDTDTRVSVTVGEWYSMTDSERPAGHPEVVSLGSEVIDSDVAIESALIFGGDQFRDHYGASRIAIEAGDIRTTFPWMEIVPAYLVTIYGEDSEDIWFRAVIDPSNAQMIHVEQSVGSGMDEDPALPQTIMLGTNYPNPFNPQTTIPFKLASTTHVRLIVHDVLGREVAVLVNETLQVGDHDVVWDASNLPSGVYFYRLAAMDEVATGRMILQK